MKRPLRVGFSLLLGALTVGLIGCGVQQTARSKSPPAASAVGLTRRILMPTTAATAVPDKAVMAAMSPGPNPFGLLLGGDQLSDQFRVDLVKALGVAYFRPWYVTVEGWTGACYDPACELAPQAGLKLILTVRNNVTPAPPFPTTPTENIESYKHTLGEILDKYRPVVLVVENEEDSDQFWFGTAEEYAAQLKAACTVAHSRQIPCANGGLSSGAVALLVWADYIDHAQFTEACSFVQRASAELAPDLCRFTAIDQLSGEARKSLATSRKLIDLYKTTGQDYLNFHWYIPDKAALSEAVTYLRQATNLPVMSNEIGQYDQSPEAVQRLLAAALELKLPYAVWFSLDRKAQALQNTDGSLRENGIAFREFMQTRFQSVAGLPSVPALAPAPATVPAFAPEPAPPLPNGDLSAATVYTDVTYCKTSDGVELKMDVYYPVQSASPAPAIVFVHGGGWVAGTKTGTPGRSYFDELNQRGYFLASIDYRLAPTYTFPANIEDVKCAIRSLRAHAKEYHIDPQRIGAWGASAGGHLVALLGTSDQSAGWDVGQYLDQSSRVQVVVDMYGISDLTTEYVVGNLRGLDRMVFGANDPNSDLLKKASPITYIKPDDPPFLILHGDMDSIVPYTQSEILHEALLAAGVPSNLIIVHNAGHGFGAVGGPLSPTPGEIARTVIGFFDQYLR